MARTEHMARMDTVSAAGARSITTGSSASTGPHDTPILTRLTLGHSFSVRLGALLLLLLIAHGLVVALVFRHASGEREAESLQRLSHDLAAHIVAHWPQPQPPAASAPLAVDLEARHALLSMLMTVNPGVQAYLLDAQGGVVDYLGDADLVRTPRVDLVPIDRYLAGAALPLRGTDPADAPGSPAARLFSVARFPAATGNPTDATALPSDDHTEPGLRPSYLYIVLDADARRAAADAADPRRTWWSAALAAGAALLLAAALGAYCLHRLTRPLQALAERMADWQLPPLPDAGQASDAGLAVAESHARAHTEADTEADTDTEADRAGDEIALLQHRFGQMQQRLVQQAEHERTQAAAHRETIAAVAHDLRSPLTALHGQLEALVPDATGDNRLQLQAALGQSDRLRHLTQQLFELAVLQATDEVTGRERLRLDELVADTVGKAQRLPGAPQVLLGQAPPEPIEVDGDGLLLERALSNLIDNARRHGRAPDRDDQAVRVSVRRDGGQAQVWVEDQGPGLPEDIGQRLVRGDSLRAAPRRSASGGLGGLGLAIAQRVAVLHGGRLDPLPAPQGGARLQLALPLSG